MNEEERLNRNTNNILEMVNRTISEGDAGLVRKLIYEYRNKNYDLKEEIERLNNIINELEKYLEKIIIDGGTRGSMTFWYRQVYDYLQELKGSGKE